MKKNNNFWKIWRNKFNKRHSLPSNISDLTNPAEIVDGFGNYFSSVCSPNNDIANDAETKFKQALDCNKEINLFKCACVSVEDIDDVVSDMKRGKACDIDGLSVEHIQYSHPSIIIFA